MTYDRVSDRNDVVLVASQKYCANSNLENITPFLIVTARTRHPGCDYLQDICCNYFTRIWDASFEIHISITKGYITQNLLVLILEGI